MHMYMLLSIELDNFGRTHKIDAKKSNYFNHAVYQFKIVNVYLTNSNNFV